MNTDKKEVVDILLGEKEPIYEQWILAQMSSDSLREDLFSIEELKSQSKTFLDELIKAVRHGNVNDIDSEEYSTLKEILREISDARAQQGFAPSETATYVFSLKDVLLSFLQEQFRDKPDVLTIELIKINKLLDQLGLYTFENYTKKREGIILRQQQEILELSTPVIQVWDGILAVPLIGTLDSIRSQIVMENLLKEITVKGAEITILDISGVPAMDTLVVQHLIRTVKAVRLMGAECIISGIRPAIAQTIVHLGVDLSDVKTKATLASALKMAFDTLKLGSVLNQC
ncbi:STAS domain-containing protein [Clostridium sp. CX1]|uniref:STAS domain-containing protein n=1 Tax=Clostridium sp. CX1 TaxID=2978346 RepID=UPI0021BF5377|nr:STAS domain-containing protein [Clostridium sp. CX1]MCT8977387.1 STAS domain-containing protein [Clostridium sp. CX1]